MYFRWNFFTILKKSGKVVPNISHLLSKFDSLGCVWNQELIMKSSNRICFYIGRMGHKWGWEEETLGGGGAAFTRAPGTPNTKSGLGYGPTCFCKQIQVQKVCSRAHLLITHSWCRAWLCSCRKGDRVNRNMFHGPHYYGNAHSWYQTTLFLTSV